MNNIKFIKLHNYIHSYEVEGLDKFLSLYEKEFDLTYSNFESRRNVGKTFNEYILNPNITIPLNNLLLSIIDRFYIVDEAWENKDFMLYSQTDKDNKPIFHNHYNVFSIASTMYLNAPNKEEGGGLEFFFNEGDKPIIQPRKDVIFFFPAWSLHRPLAHKGEKIRHCINWGYECSKRPIHKLTGDKW